VRRHSVPAVARGDLLVDLDRDERLDAVRVVDLVEKEVGVDVLRHVGGSARLDAEPLWTVPVNEVRSADDLCRSVVEALVVGDPFEKLLVVVDVGHPAALGDERLASVAFSPNSSLGCFPEFLLAEFLIHEQIERCWVVWVDVKTLAGKDEIGGGVDEGLGELLALLGAQDSLNDEIARVVKVVVGCFWCVVHIRFRYRV